MINLATHVVLHPLVSVKQIQAEPTSSHRTLAGYKYRTYLINYPLVPYDEGH
jgi:hypothetical protein